MNIDNACTPVVFYVKTIFGLDFILTSPFQKPLWKIAVGKNDTEKKRQALKPCYQKSYHLDNWSVMLPGNSALVLFHQVGNKNWVASPPVDQ